MNIALDDVAMAMCRKLSPLSRTIALQARLNRSFHSGCFENVTKLTSSQLVKELAEGLEAVEDCDQRAPQPRIGVRYPLQQLVEQFPRGGNVHIGSLAAIHAVAPQQHCAAILAAQCWDFRNCGTFRQNWLPGGGDGIQYLFSICF